MVRKDVHEENRRSWNAATVAQHSHRGDIASFLRSGGTTLFPEERDLLGDIAGQRVAHLQCGTGLDTLSLASLGARVTGVDISDTAIEIARGLARETAIPAAFACEDVYDWLATTAVGSERFDLAYSGYGILSWLSDVPLWARGIAAILRPGGRVVVIDFHPIALTINEHGQHILPYFNREALRWASGVGDYVAEARDALTPWGYVEGVQGFRNPHHATAFPWGVGDVVTALADAGLTLAALREYPYMNGAKLYSAMRELPGRRMTLPDGVPNAPLMYAVLAHTT